MKIDKDQFIFQNDLDDKKLEEMMYKKILSIIDAQKPAHTICKLNLQIIEAQG
jgi:hypothetical protein